MTTHFGPAYLYNYHPEYNEAQKQTTDQLQAYYELYNWDNFGLCDDSRRRKFEQFCTQSHYEQIGYIPLPDADTVIAYYTARYDIVDNGIPPESPKSRIPRKLTGEELAQRAVWLNNQRKAERKAKSDEDRRRVKLDQEYWLKNYNEVEMTFGGSHRENARIRRAIKDTGIRTSGSDYPVTLNSKRRSTHVHIDDVGKARSIGMSVRKS